MIANSIYFVLDIFTNSFCFGKLWAIFWLFQNMLVLKQVLHLFPIFLAKYENEGWFKTFAQCWTSHYEQIKYMRAKKWNKCTKVSQTIHRILIILIKNWNVCYFVQNIWQLYSCNKRKTVSNEHSCEKKNPANFIQGIIMQTKLHGIG